MLKVSQKAHVPIVLLDVHVGVGQGQCPLSPLIQLLSTAWQNRAVPPVAIELEEDSHNRGQSRSRAAGCLSESPQ